MKRGALALVGVLAALFIALVVIAPWRSGDVEKPVVQIGRAGEAALEPAEQLVADSAAESAESAASETAPLSTAPAEAESSGAPARQAATTTNEILIVVTSDGRPLEGAHVVVAPVLVDPLWDAAAEPHSWEREQTRGAFTPFLVLASLRTGADGVCSVAREALATTERAVVIGVLHERAYGEVRALQVADLPATDRVDIALDAAEPVRAIVNGALDGAQVEVTQSALYGDFRIIEGYTDEWVSRPLLRWTHTRTGSGSVALFPVRDRCLVTARAGDDMAPSFVGTVAGEITLELAPTFEVEGRTIDLDQPMLEALVRVQAFDAEQQRWVDRGVGAMQTDGTFAPFSVAWLETATQWRARAEACERYTVVTSFEPSPRGRHTIEFDAPNGVRFDLRVFDGVSKELLPGAHVTMDWDGRVDPPWSEITDEKGEAMFTHLPTGVRISIDVEAVGYVKEPTLVLTTDAITDRRIWSIDVFPHCRVHGRVAPSIAGRETMRAELKRVEPVATPGQKFDVEVVDGAFEFDGLGGESATLLLSNERGMCGPIEIAQGVGPVDIGTLELAPFVTARARVLDAVSGAPINGARARLFVEDGTVSHMTMGEHAFSDDLGVVRLERFPSAAAWLVIDAPGSTAGWFQADAIDGATIDFGDVVLQPERVFEVQLDGAPRRPHRFRLEEWVTPARETTFDEAGRARLPVDANAERANLIDPDGRFEQFRAFGMLADLPQPFPWPAPAGRLKLRVVGVDESYEQFLYVHTLVLAWRDEFGSYERWVPFSCRDGALPTRHVPVSNVSYRVMDGPGRLVKWGRADLAASGDQELVIDLGGDVATLRVVDADGAPLGGVYVRGFDRRYPPARHASSVGNFDTDANGEAWVPLIEGGALGLALLGPNDEIIPDVDTTDWRADALQEVVLAPKGAFEIVVRAGSGAESAVADATVGLYTSDERMRLIRWTTDDEGRLKRPLIEPTSYLVEVTKAGHWWRKLPLAVTAEPPTKLEVLLPELAHLELRLVDANGAPLANTSVELLHEGLDEFHSEWLAAGRVSAAAVTDVAGRLALDGVPAGTYVVGVGGYEVGTAATGDMVTTIAVP